MRMMFVLAALAALAVLAAPLAGQDVADVRASAPARTPAWFTPRSPAADPRLALPAAPSAPSAMEYALEARPRLSFVSMMMIGSAIGCAVGAVILSSGNDVDEREKAPVRFNGCILGAPAGMILGAATGLATGARMP